MFFLNVMGVRLPTERPKIWYIRGAEDISFSI